MSTWPLINHKLLAASLLLVVALDRIVASQLQSVDLKVHPAKQGGNRQLDWAAAGV